MADYFDDKSFQISPHKFVAFGIDITSRHGKASEVIEMISFARDAALSGVNDLIDEVFYDSVSCLCTITLVEDAENSGSSGEKLLAAAMKTLSQFQFDEDGKIFHGDSLCED